MPTTQETLDALKPEDCDVLAAAAAGLLRSDSRFTGTINELRWAKTPGAEPSERVGTRQHRRLREKLALIRPSNQVEHHSSSCRREFSSCGAAYTVTTMQLTPAGLAVVAALADGKVKPS